MNLQTEQLGLKLEAGGPGMLQEFDEVEKSLGELAADFCGTQSNFNGSDDQRLRHFELFEAGGLRSGEQCGRLLARGARLLAHLLLLLLSLHLLLQRALLLDDFRPTREERCVEQLASEWLVILAQVQTGAANMPFNHQV